MVDAMLRAAVEVASAASPDPLVLAISGGRDSMALLHAMVRWAPARIAAVATFDHGTGGPATEAAALVASEARRLGLTVVRERSRGLLATEAAWRDARWNFLRRVARAYHARVATAHTRDDQLETVVMRIMRGSGARGIAGLAAPSDIVRPWLPVTRIEVATWVAENRIEFVEDPANEDRRYLRVRMRRDLLPAIESVHPGFAEEMLSIGERASQWRRDVDQLLDDSGRISRSGSILRVDASLFDGLDDGMRAIYWQSLMGRVGVALDATGTRELVRFSKGRRRGAQLQLAGGALVLLARHDSASAFELRPPATPSVVIAPVRWTGVVETLPRRVGKWRFGRIEPSSAPDDESPWVFGLPSGVKAVIRPWSAGDRLLVDENHPRRRVARYFVEAGVPSPDRPTWPVVLLDVEGEDSKKDEVVWVPGVCRSRAAPFRSGRSDLIWFRCERELS